MRYRFILIDVLCLLRALDDGRDVLFFFTLRYHAVLDHEWFYLIMSSAFRTMERKKKASKTNRSLIFLA